MMIFCLYFITTRQIRFLERRFHGEEKIKMEMMNWR